MAQQFRLFAVLDVGLATRLLSVVLAHLLAIVFLQIDAVFRVQFLVGAAELAHGHERLAIILSDGVHLEVQRIVQACVRLLEQESEVTVELVVHSLHVLD